jgi:hypothetical protein
MKYIYFIIPSVIIGIILGVILGVIYTKRNTKCNTETNLLPKNCEFVDIRPDLIKTGTSLLDEYKNSKYKPAIYIPPGGKRDPIKAIIKENIIDAKEYFYNPYNLLVYNKNSFYAEPIGKVYSENGNAKEFDDIYIINKLTKTQQDEFNKTQEDEFNKTQQDELYELKKLYNAKQKKLHIIDKSIYNQVYDIIE